MWGKFPILMGLKSNYIIQHNVELLYQGLRMHNWEE